DEAPDIGVEAAELFLHVEETPRILDRRFDLQPITNDARIAHQLLDRARVETRDAHGIEFGERAAVAFALAEHRAPAQARLRGLEHEELEVHAILVHGDAPLAVVILDHVLVPVRAPRATNDFRHPISSRPRAKHSRGSARKDTTVAFGLEIPR